MGKSTIGDAIAATLGDVSSIDTSVRLIPHNQLHLNPSNFYPALDFDALQELGNSILANGLLEPLVVTPCKPDGYRIISGHSRWRALNLPYVSRARPDLVRGVPCVVLPSMSKEQELCAIIEANRQRVKNAATLAEEAERLTAAYVKRKKAGEELPGRIRDRVAESLKVSASKLAMATATREHLTLPGFRAQWQEGKLPDTVAYEISKMDGDHQYRLLDYLCNEGREASDLTVAEVRKLEERFNDRPRSWDMPRAKEDELFLDAAARLLENLNCPEWSRVKTRAEAIAALKHFNSGCGGGESEWDIHCDAKGVTVRNGAGAPKITRTWPETYDAMCICTVRDRMEACGKPCCGRGGGVNGEG